MTKHYIYEIFGKKIGATNDVKRRMQEQGIKDGEYRVIEEHSNAKTTSIREMELQKEYGYKVDNLPYWKTLKMQKKATTPQARNKAVANTDYKARDAKIDWKSRDAKIDWKAARIKGAANTDYKVARAKAVANTDYKARDAKIDWKARTAKIDWVANAEKHKKSINQYSLEGTFIKNWDSAVDAARELNLYSSGIGMCCRNVIKTAGKFIWKFAN